MATLLHLPVAIHGACLLGDRVGVTDYRIRQPMDFGDVIDYIHLFIWLAVGLSLKEAAVNILNPWIPWSNQNFIISNTASRTARLSQFKSGWSIAKRCRSSFHLDTLPILTQRNRNLQYCLRRSSHSQAEPWLCQTYSTKTDAGLIRTSKTTFPIVWRLSLAFVIEDRVLPNIPIMLWIISVLTWLLEPIVLRAFSRLLNIIVEGRNTPHWKCDWLLSPW